MKKVGINKPNKTIVNIINSKVSIFLIFFAFFIIQGIEITRNPRLPTKNIAKVAEYAKKPLKIFPDNL